MSAQSEQKDSGHAPWKLWFHLTEEERWLVVAILALALLGLTARYIHLRSQEPDPAPAVETR